MDYDGFRQMVLGANLRPIPKGDAVNIGGPQGKYMKFVATYNNITNIGYDEEVVRQTLSMSLEDKLEAPRG